MPNRATHSQRLTLAGLIVASGAYALMQTFLIPALAPLERELDTSTAWVTWTVTAYLLSGAVSTPIIGRLGDQYGKRRLMLISLGVFLLGSVGAIFAPDIGTLIGFRVVQGVGGAAFPLSYAIIRDEFPPERIPVAMGTVSSVLGVGGGVGIALSGVIVDNASWRWLFVVSALLVAAAVVMVWRFVPESPVRAPARPDVAGALLLSGGLVALLVGVTEGEGWGWGSPAVLGLLGGSALLFVVWGAVELRVAEPMVDMRMLARRPVLFTNLTALLSGFALYMTWVILPGFFQLPRGLPDDLAALGDYGFGTTVTVAGLWILPTSAAIVISGPVAGLLGRRYGSRLPLTAGMVLLAAGSAMIALFHATPLQVSACFAVCGVGIGFSFAAMPRLVSDAVPPSETGVANGMNTVIRTVGGVIGAQIGAAVLTASAVGGGPVPAESGYVTAFWIGAGAAVLGAGAAALVAPGRTPRRAVLTPRDGVGDSA
ncbi:MFS transporter [Miltoncostaea marina]|uniref:MFS transporter n=1 Tax=Miltoncostaea marina TaxID=2843215 RepID=UPI001C3D5372|nr:MFS transporter [Miltoncostaea marina]